MLSIDLTEEFTSGKKDLFKKLQLDIITAAVIHCQENYSAAARMLGMTPRNIFYWVNKYNIDTKNKKYPSDKDIKIRIKDLKYFEQVIGIRVKEYKIKSRSMLQSNVYRLGVKLGVHKYTVLDMEAWIIRNIESGCGVVRQGYKEPIRQKIIKTKEYTDNLDDMRFFKEKFIINYKEPWENESIRMHYTSYYKNLTFKEQMIIDNWLDEEFVKVGK